MAAKLLVQYKRQISGLELEPSVGGCFELTVGDELIFSKLETGLFPEDEDIIKQVGKRIHG
ncbi:MAG: selenoprotein [Planctomycetaceae bacterium]|nr:selenoprotein [Planctomycetaceae bacterium]MBT6723676.1 SelT/SelW/SelH family protein [Planctomycetaceae bacterium]